MDSPGRSWPRARRAFVTNTRSLPAKASTYETERFQKKLLIQLVHSPRAGTDGDVDKMTTTFQRVGFDVETFFVTTQRESMMILKRFSATEFTDYGCIIFAIVNHGPKKMYGVRNIIEIWDYFSVPNNPTLDTKPRILILQDSECGTPTKSVSAEPSKPIVHKGIEGTWLYQPKELDTMTVYLPYLGNPELRDDNNGSSLQSFCKKIGEMSATCHLQSILTEVNKDIHFKNSNHVRYNNGGNSISNVKKASFFISTLTRNLFLKKYDDDFE